MALRKRFLWNNRTLETRIVPHWDGNPLGYVWFASELSTTTTSATRCILTLEPRQAVTLAKAILAADAVKQHTKSMTPRIHHEK